jgi:phospholipase C
MANGSGLAQVQHIVVLMLENRSFDHPGLTRPRSAS